MSVDAVTRQEMYLQYLAGDTAITLPEPVTRIEKYWWDIAKRIESGVGTGGGITVDSALSETSTNPVQNKVVSKRFGELSEQKVDKSSLTLGVGADGYVYLFVNGSPQGNGLDIKADVIEGDVIGYVDTDNTIVLTGSLADGTYTLKYEMENGTVVNIGDMVLDSNTYYSITNNLTNCTNGNSATKVVEGYSYSATISANTGYTLSSVTVTMGGADITSSAVSGGSISIAEVTGDIVITAVANVTAVLDPVTVDITLTDGVRVGSDGTDRTQAGYCATPHIDLTNIPKPCVINLTGARWSYEDTAAAGAIMCYATKKSDGSRLFGGPTNESVGSGYITLVLNNGDRQNVTVTVTSDEVGSIRFSGDWGSTSDSTTMAGDDVNATLTYTPVA